MEEIINKIFTKKGAEVHLIQPESGPPFFRYFAGADALIDNFRYIIKQHGLSDTANVTVNVELPANSGTDQQKFNDELNSFLKCLEEFLDGENQTASGGTMYHFGTLALTNLLGIDEGQPLNDDWLDEVFNNFEEVFPPMENVKFDFKERLGVYRYNTEEKAWSFEKHSENVVTIYFPSEPASTSNDAVLTINDYEHVKLQDGGDPYYLPRRFHLNLSIGKDRYFGILLSEADNKTAYYQSGLPISMDLNVFIHPYSIKFNVKNRSDNDGTFYLDVEFFITRTDKCRLGISGTLKFPHNDLNKVEEDEWITENVKMYLNNITIDGIETIHKAALMDLDTQDEIDKIMNVGVHVNDSQVGRLRLLMDKYVEADLDDDGTTDFSMDIDVIVQFALNLDPKAPYTSVRDKFISFFDDYFDNTKPSGFPRNDAFNHRGSASYQTADGGPKTVMEVENRALDGVSSGIRKRTSRKPLDDQQRLEKLNNYFINGTGNLSTEKSL